MEYILSHRIQSIQPSPTLAVSALAAKRRAQGHDIINLSVGEPDFDTPDFIKSAAVTALNKGQTKYTLVGGTPALKKAIKEKLARDNNLNYDESEIIVSCGAKHSIFNALQTLINPNDEVVIPAPYWVSYPDMVVFAGGKPVIVSTQMDNGLKLSPDQLEAAITPQTKLLILNSPCNPSGVTYTQSDLNGLAQVLLKYPQVFVLTDDIYEHIIWDTSYPFVNLLNVCPSLTDRTLAVNGVSKAYAMTGWRIGFTAGPKPVITAMTKLQSQSTSNPNSIAQAASQAALQGDQTCVKSMVETFKKRYHLVHDRINQLPGMKCLDTVGTFYCFPNVQETLNQLGLKTDLEFAQHLLEKANTAVVPGSAFGCPGFIRFSFATHEDTLTKALDRIEESLRA